MPERFLGSPHILEALRRMVRQQRISQTLLLDGAEGVGKATLARIFAAELLGDPAKIEQDDLSLPHNQEVLADREKWTSEKRAEDPLLFSSHPDFVTFAPDGPLRQISIQQMRLLKERSQLKPLKGSWRVFLIDRLDRANEQAANSLLKTLEEPPPHLILIATAVNSYDLLPTIRSRALQFHLGPVPDDAMRALLVERGADQVDRRIAIARGAPGLALSLDLEAWDRRREAMLKLLEVAASRQAFSEWLPVGEALAARKTEKLESLIDILYALLEDLLAIRSGVPGLRNPDLRRRLEPLAEAVSFDWIRRAAARVDELVELARRNIQKGPALDAFAVALRR